MATIQLEHITKVYPHRFVRLPGAKDELLPPADDGTGSPRTAEGIVALKDINLTIENGETLSVIGPSGCGKSTLLRVIAGLETPTSGRVLYDRKDMAEVGPGERGIGIVFQTYALYPHMSSKENLGFFFRIHKREPEIDERVRITAEVLGVGFDALLGRMPKTLSAGQQQRVALGRCIVRDPKLILLDEPLSSLDAKLRERTRAELKRLLHRFEVTSVYVTHDQVEAIALADRLAVMRHGTIEQVGSYWEVYDRPATAFVGSFVGTPPMNFLPARVRGDEIEIGGVGLLPRPMDRYLPLLPMTLGIRPDDIELAPDDPHAFPLLVDVVEYLPSDRCYYAYATIGQARVTAKIRSEQPVRVGDRLPVRFVFARASYFDEQSGVRLA